MSKMNLAEQYRTLGTESGVEDASPHRLIQMLMEGAMEKIAIAKGHMLRNETALKGEYIGWAAKIIGGLDSCLDFEQGKEIAENLDKLYRYMLTRLLEANMDNDVAKLDEVHTLLKDIKEAWDQISTTINAMSDDPANVSEQSHE